MTAERCQLISFIADFVTTHFINLIILFFVVKIRFYCGVVPQLRYTNDKTRKIFVDTWINCGYHCLGWTGSLYLLS